ncbi:MAG: hypothetical protein EBW42_15270 [Rhodobacterales bacterium]|nr:hypothetical protein [Rhodobacterales bacterium]
MFGFYPPAGAPFADVGQGAINDNAAVNELRAYSSMVLSGKNTQVHAKFPVGSTHALPRRPLPAN